MIYDSKIFDLQDLRSTYRTEKQNIQNEQAQTVVHSDQESIRDSSQDILFKLKQEKDFSIENITNIFKPQGLTISHDVRVPLVENLFKGIPSMASCGDSLGNLFTNVPKILDYKFWLSMLVILGIYDCVASKHSGISVTIKRIQYVCLSMLCVIVTFAESVVIFQTIDGLEKKFKDFFWESLLPMWESLRVNKYVQNDVPTEDLDMEVMQPQGFNDHLPHIVASISAMLSILIGFKVKEKFVSSLVNLTKVTPMQTNNITLALVTCVNGLGDLLRKIGLTEMSEYFYIDACKDVAVSRYVEKTNSFINRISAGEIYSSAYHSEVFGELVNNGQELIRKAEKGSYELRILGDSLKKLQNCSDKIESYKNSLNGTRVETLGILIKGGPGTFKTILSDRISKLVGTYTIPEEWREDYENSPKTFQYALPKDKFYDGYNYKAWIVTSDDIFQARDAVGDPNSEAVRLISIINTAEYVLPMAEISAKNNMFFRSPFFIATTNLTNWANISSVESVEAVRRRFNLEIDVKVNQKYTKNVDGVISTDFSKLPTLDSQLENSILEGLVDAGSCTMIPNDFWDLYIIEKKGDNVTKSRLTNLEEIVILAIEAHRLRVQNFYVNKMVDSMYIDALKDKLDSKFANKKDFSNLIYETFKPQSGNVPGFFPESPRWEFRKSYRSLSDKDRDLFVRRYYFMCSQLNAHYTVFMAGFKGFVEFIDHVLPLDDNLLLKEAWFNHQDKFFTCVFNFMKRDLVRGVNPLTQIEIVKIDLPKEETVLCKIKNSLNGVLAFVEDYKVPLIIGGVLLGSSLFWLCGLFTSVTDTIITPQSVDLGRDRGKVGKPVKISLAKYKNEIANRPQSAKFDVKKDFALPKINLNEMGLRGNNCDVLNSVMNKYLFIMYVVRTKGDKVDITRFGHCWNIKGRIFAMPFHFLYKLNDIKDDIGYETGVYLTTATKATKYVLPLNALLNNFKASEDSCAMDYCLVKIDAAHLSSAGLYKHIAKNNDVMRLIKARSFPATIAGTYSSMQSDSNVVRIGDVTAKFESDVYVEKDWGESRKNGGPQEIYMISGVFMYRSTFGDGDCGSILSVAGNDFENRTIFGMHIAGSNDKGYSNIITQENIDKLIESTFPDEYIFNDELDSEFVNLKIPEEGIMQPQGNIKPGFVPSSALGSDLKRSLLFGKLPAPYKEVKFFPSKLRPFTSDDGEIVDPLKKALAKYRKEPIYLNPLEIDRAIDSYEQLVNLYFKTLPEFRTVVPLELALHSFGNVRAISPATSAGFPHGIAGSPNLKKLYYKACFDGNEELKQTLLGQIAKVVQEVLDLYSRKIRPCFIYKDCPKDEKRPLEKVLSGSTRLFSAGDWILLVLVRMYFGCFVSDFFDANIDVGSAIGLNPYSKDWDDLARYLLKFSENRSEASIGAGDYSAFDTCARPIVMEKVLEMINRWYGTTNPDNYIRSALWAEVVNSKHVCNDEFFIWYTGMPSGNALTALINTICNNVYFRMCWIKTGLPIDVFNSSVRFTSLGDDNVFSVSQEYREYFNELTLVDLMEQIGMVYTTELKGVAELPFRNLSQVEFLKRSFRFDYSLNRWVAPLRMESIFATLNWTRKGFGSDQITADELSSSFGELSLHGRSVFNQFAPKLMDLKNRYLDGYEPSKGLSLNFDIVYNDTLKSDFSY
jgi:hypothetical protein